MLSDRLIPEEIEYNTRAGRYTRKGKFISDSEVQGLVLEESNILGTNLRKLTEKLVSGEIDIPTWEKRFAETLKTSHIRMLVLSQGGKGRTGLNAYGIAGRRLKEEYRNLDNFAFDLFRGRLSVPQALARSRLYGQSAIQTYYEGYHYGKIVSGFRLARRYLDPMAKHCSECPGYVTPGYVPIHTIVPKGVACSCRGNCRCRIVYRR